MEFSENKIKEIHDLVKKKYEEKFPEKMGRFYHIEGVAKMCNYLANIYNVDISRAIVAGLVHDYYKYESIDEMKKLVNKSDLDECLKYPVLFHSYASACALNNVFNIDDKEIYSAIRNHVFGHTNMTRLEEIVLISDYTEETRKYDSCIKARKILYSGNLNMAIYVSTRDTINNLKKRNLKIHPMQEKVLYEYERKINNE